MPSRRDGWAHTLIVSDTTTCVPLEAVNPGQFRIDVSRWNDVRGKNVPLPGQLVPYVPPPPRSGPFLQFT